MMIGFISVVIIAIIFAPMFYRIHKRLDHLQKEISDLKNNMEK